MILILSLSFFRALWAQNESLRPAVEKRPDCAALQSIAPGGNDLKVKPAQNIPDEWITQQGESGIKAWGLLSEPERIKLRKLLASAFDKAVLNSTGNGTKPYWKPKFFKVRVKYPGPEWRVETAKLHYIFTKEGKVLIDLSFPHLQREFELTFDHIEPID